MGYRSEWRLALAASTQEKLDEILKWMKYYSQDVSNREGERQIMQFILSCKENQDENTCSFFDNYTKCYPLWGYVVCTIRDRCREDDELDCAYVRIGEDLDDIEIQRGKYISMYISRSLDDPQYDEIPLKNKSPTKEMPKEETCSCCGKTKDFGNVCWWCGK